MAAKNRRVAPLIAIALSLVILIVSSAQASPGFAQSAQESLSAAGLASVPEGIEIGPEGGTVDLPSGDLEIPASALTARSRFSRHTVEARFSNGLGRFNPLGDAVRIEARRSDDGTLVGRLQRPGTLRLLVDDHRVSPDRVAVRVLKSEWELVPSSYDAGSKTIRVDLTQLPAIVALVDTGLPIGTGEWDPKDPAAVQLSNNTWGVAYHDGAGTPTLYYRTTLGSQEPYYWLDPVTIDTGSDAPAMVQLGGTTALFYRKAAGTIKQVFMKTSTDSGRTWSTATQLTTEAVSVYHVQASIVGGTVYLFWSLSDTSGLLQYRTSTDLAAWAIPVSVGQAVGPLSGQTMPVFDIKKLASSTWMLTWLNPATANEGLITCGNTTGYPVVWAATSDDLAATAWSNKQELTKCFSERWAKGLSLAQASSGTVYLAFSRRCGFDNLEYHGFYRTTSDGGVTWALSTHYGYEPARGTGCDTYVAAHNSYLVLDNGGAVRAFWDQQALKISSYTEGYPAQVYLRDLSTGAFRFVPPAKEILAEVGPCRPATVFVADPVNVATGGFTLPEADVSVPGRGPGLSFVRSYNSGRLIDGPLGFGWSHNYETNLVEYSTGEVLIVDCLGRSDLYKPNGSGGYDAPPGNFAALVRNGDGSWTLTERNQVKRTFSSTGKLTTIADRNNNTVTLTYDGSGKLTMVTDPGGRSLTLTYTGSRISSIADPLGRNIIFTYGPAGDLSSVVDRGGKTWSYTYDADHRMLTKIDPNNHTVLTNTYGTQGRVVSQKDAKNGETKFQYSGGGGSTVQIDPRGNSTTHTFDTQYRVTQVADASGGVTYTYDASNNLTCLKDQLNWRTAFTYDGFGNVTSKIDALNTTTSCTLKSGGVKWNYTYNALNDVVTETDPLGRVTTHAYNTAGNRITTTNALNQTTAFGRDAYGQMTSLTDARGKATTFTFDSYGHPTGVTNPYNKTWTTAYDLAGRKTSVPDPLNHATTYTYNSGDYLTSVTDARGKVTSYAYDNAGNRTSVTDPNLKVTSFAYDEKNRLVTVTDAANGVTGYAYDANDNRTSLTDARSSARTWTYDALNRVLTESDPLGKTTSFQYDAVGNRTLRSDPTGAFTIYTYDALHRLTATKHPGGTLTHAYNAVGLRTSMADATGTTTYGYDALNRPSSVTFPGNKVVSYQYDAAGNRTRVTYPDSKTADYGYDDANRLSTVTDWVAKVTSYSYDDAGRLTSTAYPTGVTEARGYNEADQLASIQATKAPDTLTSFSYTLDNAGLRTAVQDPTGTESYTYDSLYRLAGVAYPDSVTQSYTYDAVGNRLTKVQGTTTSYTYDAGDRMLTAGADTYSYDQNGNLRTKTAAGATTNYCWDAFDRLARVVTDPAAPACPVEAVRINSGRTLTPANFYTDGAGNWWPPDRSSRVARPKTHFPLSLIPLMTCCTSSTGREPASRMRFPCRLQGATH